MFEGGVKLIAKSVASFDAGGTVLHPVVSNKKTIIGITIPERWQNEINVLELWRRLEFMGEKLFPPPALSRGLFVQSAPARGDARPTGEHFQSPIWKLAIGERK